MNKQQLREEIYTVIADWDLNRPYGGDVLADFLTDLFFNKIKETKPKEKDTNMSGILYAINNGYNQALTDWSERMGI